ncbi:MAG: aldo/keto reductase, partial [Yaniella sp.]|nr:aldo/keto reductase [Yaniella sp.]
GKYRKLEDFEGVDREGQLSQFANETGLNLVKALVSVSDDVGAVPASVSLAWLLAKGVTAPIASARVPEQLEALVAAPNVELSAEHIAQLDKASEAYL